MTAPLFSSKDNYFLLQGVRALQCETEKQRAALLNRLFPSDNNLQTLVEYYDKRMIELKTLEKTIANYVNNLPQEIETAA